MSSHSTSISSVHSQNSSYVDLSQVEAKELRPGGNLYTELLALIAAVQKDAHKYRRIVTVAGQKNSAASDAVIAQVVAAYGDAKPLIFSSGQLLGIAVQVFTGHKGLGQGISIGSEISGKHLEQVKQGGIAGLNDLSRRNITAGESANATKQEVGAARDRLSQLFEKTLQDEADGKRKMAASAA